jgi:hypothetical protein
MYKKYVTPGLGGENFISYQCKMIINKAGTECYEDKNTDDWSGNKLADYAFIQARLKGLTGKVLTIIDASIPEGKQNKCIKDLIREVFINEFADVSELLYDETGKFDKVTVDGFDPEKHIATAEEILEA